MRRAIVAGSIGGALTGLLDAWMVLRGPHMLSPPLQRSLWLVCAGSGAVAGLVGATLLLGLFVLGQRLAKRYGAKVPSDWAGAIAPAVLAAPLIVLVGTSFFKGGKASQIPGRQVLSLLIIGIGFLKAGWFGRWQGRMLADANRRLPFVLLFLGAAFALGFANGTVLQRLYPWMHTALSAGTFVASALAIAHLFPSPHRFVAAANVVLVVALSFVGFELLGRSSELRVFALERTNPTKVVLRKVPMPARRLAAAVVPDSLGLNTANQAPLPPGPTLPEADVLLLTIDALRPEHVGAYGYGRNTTPNIDRIAARGIRFERAYAQAPHTSFSVASMLTGKYYAALSRLNSGSSEEAFPTLLRSYGWRTAAFYPPAVFFVDGEKLAGFRDTHFQFEYVKFEFLSAEGRIDQLREYYSGIGDARVFAWVHFFEPHEPYEKHPGHDFGPSDKDRYDSEIAYTDAAIGKIIADFEARRPGGIIIISADHGEEFDDHGGRYHGTTLYDEQIRVPLIIAGRGIPHGVRAGPVELVDLAPTIGRLLGFSVPARMRGTDLGPWLTATPPDNERLGPVFAELGSQRMMVQSQHKLLCRMDIDLCQLYDLAADPGERKNLADLQPQRVASMRAAMDAWVKEQVQLETAGADADVPVAILRGRLGDASSAEALIAMVADRASKHRGEAARVLAGLTLEKRMLDGIRAANAALPPGDEAATWLMVAGYRAGEESFRGAVAEAASLGLTTPVALPAALALAEKGAEEGLKTLIAAIAGDGCGETAMCRRVANALGHLGHKDAVPALLSRLPDVMTRLQVVQALGMIADPRSQPALIERLSTDEYVPVRSAAATALGRLPGAAAKAALVRAQRSEKESPVQDAIRAALAVDRGLRP